MFPKLKGVCMTSGSLNKCLWSVLWGTSQKLWMCANEEQSQGTGLKQDNNALLDEMYTRPIAPKLGKFC